MELGRLERVDLRAQLSGEATDFTPWLAEEGSLELLGETLGMELELVGAEQRVGPFRADILCRDTLDGSYVLIENQLDRTDHVHLGQLITYAAGLHAATIVWIAARVTDEHRAALDWLNEITDEAFRFFALEVELWRIGDSRAAPRFNVVSKPNDWSREVGRAAASGEVTELGQFYLRYWNGLRQLMEASDAAPTARKPLPQQWTGFAIGRANFELNAFVNRRDRWIRAELTLRGPSAKGWFQLLEGQRDEVEQEIGFPLDWDAMENRQAARIATSLTDVDVADEQRWPRQHAWLRDRLTALDRVFRARVRALPADARLAATGVEAEVDRESAAGAASGALE